MIFINTSLGNQRFVIEKKADVAGNSNTYKQMIYRQSENNNYCLKCAREYIRLYYALEPPTMPLLFVLF